RFTFDSDKFLEETGLGDYGFDVSGSASVVELGVGIRPYLTPVESNNQFFLFGMATYNFLSEKAEASFQGISASADTSYNKFGLAAGAGFEFPAGTSVNIIVQGVFRFIFTESYTDDFGDKYGGVTTFVGITGGVAF
ncbi:MAG: hypothetical protein P8Y60_18775, partial [Calditrichota bacterium]